MKLKKRISSNHEKSSPKNRFQGYRLEKYPSKRKKSSSRNEFGENQKPEISETRNFSGVSGFYETESGSLFPNMKS